MSVARALAAVNVKERYTQLDYDKMRTSIGVGGTGTSGAASARLSFADTDNLV
jgi:hypothetical protein